MDIYYIKRKMETEGLFQSVRLLDCISSLFVLKTS